MGVFSVRLRPCRCHWWSTPSATTRDGVSVNFNTPQFVSDGGEDHLRVGARRCSEATPVSARVRASRAAADGGGDLFHDLPRRPQGVWARHATTPSPSRPAAAPPLGRASVALLQARPTPRIRTSSHHSASRPRRRFALGHIVAPLPSQVDAPLLDAGLLLVPAQPRLIIASPPLYLRSSATPVRSETTEASALSRWWR